MPRFPIANSSIWQHTRAMAGKTTQCITRIGTRGPLYDTSSKLRACITRLGRAQRPERLLVVHYDILCRFRLFPRLVTRKPPSLHRARRNASPNVNKPYAASKDSMMGTGFRSLMARGIADPPRTRDARRLSSTPYGSLLATR